MSGAAVSNQVTALLRRMATGDRSAENDLYPLIYRELHAIAGSLLRHERRDHTLQPTARVNAINIRIAEIDRQTATPLHISLVSDLLTDGNGWSFHRFQIVIWTIILGVIFGISTYNDLLMPDFSATLLGLMGISSGTYIGFKFPESKN
jgi:hypothetical protein